MSAACSLANEIEPSGSTILIPTGLVSTIRFRRFRSWRSSSLRCSTSRRASSASYARESARASLMPIANPATLPSAVPAMGVKNGRLRPVLSANRPTTPSMTAIPATQRTTISEYTSGCRSVPGNQNPPYKSMIPGRMISRSVATRADRGSPPFQKRIRMVAIAIIKVTKNEINRAFPTAVVKRFQLSIIVNQENEPY